MDHPSFDFQRNSISKGEAQITLFWIQCNARCVSSSYPLTSRVGGEYLQTDQWSKVASIICRAWNKDLAKLLWVLSVQLSARISLTYAIRGYEACWIKISIILLPAFLSTFFSHLFICFSLLSLCIRFSVSRCSSSQFCPS